MAQAFNFQKKTEKSLGNTMTVNFDVNRKGCDEENGSRLAGVLLERVWKVFSQRWKNFRWIWVSMKAKTANDSICKEPAVL